MSSQEYEVTPDKRQILSLLTMAYEGRACLPNFQRDFVWNREGVADLLRSVLRQYYIGSLLLLRSNPDDPPFDPVPLRGAKAKPGGLRPELLILDGQQRLTSLLYALAAPNLPLKDAKRPRRYFIDLMRLIDSPEDEETIQDFAVDELRGLDTTEAQYRRWLLPCTAMISSDAFLHWRDGLDDWLRDQDSGLHARFREEWRSPWTKAVEKFQSFMVPLVELPQVQDSNGDALGRVCAIFEKLNSTGVELSVYDLLTARMYRHGIRIHDLWKETCRKHKRIYAWSEGKAETHKFGVLILRTLALLRDLDPKPKMLINLSPTDFAKDWRHAAEAVERALELVEHVGPDGFGVFHPKWLPGFGLIPVLAALRSEIERLNLGDAARRDLRQWYWSNVFLERFSSGVESKSRKDYAEMIRYWMDGGSKPAVFAEARARIGAEGYSIRTSASYASAVYSGVFCLLANQGARDWAINENIQLQKLNDHHIFPRAYLREKGLTTRSVVNSIVNRTLISNKTNALIKAKAPSEYLQMPALTASSQDPEILSRHFLDDSSVGAMHLATEGMDSADLQNVYEQFCEARERRIIQEIRRQCGIEEKTHHGDRTGEPSESLAGERM